MNTQESYLRQVPRFAWLFNESPELLAPEHIWAHQVDFNEEKLSAGSIAIAIAALRFLYRVTLKKEWCFYVLPGKACTWTPAVGQ